MRERERQLIAKVLGQRSKRAGSLISCVKNSCVLCSFLLSDLVWESVLFLLYLQVVAACLDSDYFIAALLDKFGLVEWSK